MKTAKSSAVLIFTVVFLLMTPVLALPKTNSQFTETVSIANAGNVSQGTVGTAGSVLFVAGAISTGCVTYRSGVDLSGDLWTKLTGFYDTSTLLGFFYGKWQSTTPKGTFAGNAAGETTSIDANTFRIRGTYVGFGNGFYQGNRIKGSFSGVATAGNLQISLVMIGVLSDKM